MDVATKVTLRVPSQQLRTENQLRYCELSVVSTVEDLCRRHESTFPLLPIEPWPITSITEDSYIFWGVGNNDCTHCCLLLSSRRSRHPRPSQLWAPRCPISLNFPPGLIMLARSLLWPAPRCQVYVVCNIDEHIPWSSLWTWYDFRVWFLTSATQIASPVTRDIAERFLHLTSQIGSHLQSLPLFGEYEYVDSIELPSPSLPFASLSASQLSGRTLPFARASQRWIPLIVPKWTFHIPTMQSTRMMINKDEHSNSRLFMIWIGAPFEAVNKLTPLFMLTLCSIGHISTY